MIFTYLCEDTVLTSFDDIQTKYWENWASNPSEILKFIMKEFSVKFFNFRARILIEKTPSNGYP
jgi:hypothetical protein